MAIILCLVAGLLPALITPGLLFYFDVTPKVLVLLIGTSCALTLSMRRRSVAAFAGKPLAIAIGLQAAALLAATALSTHPALSLSGTNWRRFGMVTQLSLLAFTFLAAAVIARRENALLWLLRTVAATGCAIAFYAILQYFGVDPFIPASAYRAGEGAFTIVRPPGTLGHADYLAVYLLFVIFAGLALGQIETRKFLRLAGVACALVSGLATILSGTRSAWLGLLAGLIFLFFRLRPRIVRIHWYGAAVAIALISAFYVSPAGARFRARIHWIHEDSFGGARLLLWRDAALMAGSRWTIGFGPETFSAEFPRYQSVELARQYPDFYHESPHNIFLDTFSEQGIAGLAGLLFLTGIGLRCAWKARRESAAAFVGGALAAMFVSLQFSAFVVSSALFYYLAIAILAAQSRKQAAFAANWARWTGAVGSLALAALFLWFGARLTVAEHGIAEAQHDIARNHLDAAIANYERASRWQPPGVSYDLPYSREMAQYSSGQKDPLTAMRAGQQAIQAAVRATRDPEERQNALYYLATLFGSQNDSVNTEKCLRAAITAAPNWFKPHWTLARLLFFTGRLREAKVEAAAAIDLDGGKHAEVVRTVEQIR